MVASFPYEWDVERCTLICNAHKQACAKQPKSQTKSHQHFTLGSPPVHCLHPRCVLATWGHQAKEPVLWLLTSGLPMQPILSCVCVCSQGNGEVCPVRQQTEISLASTVFTHVHCTLPPALVGCLWHQETYTSRTEKLANKLYIVIHIYSPAP